MRAGLLRVRIDAMCDFQAVNISIVLNLPADSIAYWLGKKPENTEDQENHRQRGPVAEFADVPAGAETAQHPAGDTIDEIKSNEQAQGSQRQPIPDVVEHIVSHLMAKDEERLRGCGLLDGGVPDNNTLGWAEAGDVSVEFVSLLAGFHEKDSIARDGKSTALRDSFNRIYQLRIGLLKRFKLVEQWINNERLADGIQHNERQQDQPEIKPPARGALADDHDHQPQQHGASHRSDEKSFADISEPGRPALNRKTVLQTNAVMVGIERQIQQGGRQQEQRHSDHGLDKAPARRFLGPVTVSRHDTEVENRQQLDETINRADDEQLDSQVVKRLSLGQLVRRQHVSRGRSC